jgi:hypothetical protein
LLAIIAFLFLNINYRATFNANQLQTTNNDVDINGDDLIRRIKVGDLRLVIQHSTILALLYKYSFMFENQVIYFNQM